jgi:hypothetical protein
VFEGGRTKRWIFVVFDSPNDILFLNIQEVKEIVRIARSKQENKIGNL